MADSLFVKKLNELITAGAEKAVAPVTKQLDQAANQGKTNAPPASLPPFPIPPASQKLLKEDEVKYLHSLPLEKRPAVPMVGTAPNFDDKAFQTAYKTLLFDYRDQEAKRKKEAAAKAAAAQAP